MSFVAADQAINDIRDFSVFSLLHWRLCLYVDNKLTILLTWVQVWMTEAEMSNMPPLQVLGHIGHALVPSKVPLINFAGSPFFGGGEGGVKRLSGTRMCRTCCRHYDTFCLPSYLIWSLMHDYQTWEEREMARSSVNQSSINDGTFWCTAWKARSMTQPAQ